MSQAKKVGAPRKYQYTGEKKITSIRLSGDEKLLIKSCGFSSVQEFVQYSLDKLKRKGNSKKEI